MKTLILTVIITTQFLAGARAMLKALDIKATEQAITKYVEGK